jgi:CBS domain-containing protein
MEGRPPVQSLLVREVMTEAPAVLHATHSLRAAQRIFADKHYQHLPVVRAGKLVGIVTDRDIATFMAKRPGALDLEVAAAMTERPKTIAAGASIAEAARLLVEHGIHCLPVVDEGGVLLGIVTPTDLLRLLIRLLSRADHS